MSEPIHASLLLVAAALFALWTVRSVFVRRLLGLLLITTTWVGLYLTDRSWAQALLTLVLFTLVGTSMKGYEDDLARAEDSEAQARRDAERRAQLLEAVRDLPELDLKSAAHATAAALRAFGMSGSVVAMVHDDRIVPIELEGIDPLGHLLRTGEGLLGAAIARREVVVADDYQSFEGRLTQRGQILSAIAVPIRVDDDVVGVLAATMDRVGGPRREEQEVVEVLASHLSAVVATRRQLENQRMLLRRIEQLDVMRAAFAQDISDELRDPLTFIRQTSHTMLSQAETLRDDERTSLLDRLAERAHDLQVGIDALLNFSRFQTDGKAPDPRRVSLRTLLAPLTDRVTVAPDAATQIEVLVDASLVRQAVALLAAGSTVEASFEVDASQVLMTLTPTRVDGQHNVMRTLVARLLAETGATLVDDTSRTVVLPRARRPPETVREVVP